MSITTYSELQSAVADWLARSDLTDRIPDFITLFETQVNVRLLVRKMEATTSLTTTLGVASVPTDFLGWRRLGYTVGNKAGEVEYVTPSYLNAAFPTATTDSPRLWTITGSSIVVRPYDDTSNALTLDYYQGLPVLSDSNTTNWLLTKLPGAYLAGALSEAYGFIKKLEDQQLWAARAEAWTSALETNDAKVRGPSAVKVLGATP